jgi:hypothetical protein
MSGCKWDVLLMQSERLLPGVGTSDATALAIGTLAPIMGGVRTSDATALSLANNCAS